MSTKYTPMEREQAVENIAIGVHTGLRKGSDAPSSGDLWQAIGASTDSAWLDACTYCIAGLESMGYRICKVEETDEWDKIRQEAETVIALGLDRDYSGGQELAEMVLKALS